MSLLAEAAPAKLNLALHVRGRLADGRHRIETLFAFCEHGDRLTATKAETLSLDVIGPFADELPANEENLVLAAARSLGDAAGIEGGASLCLEKTLPIASGIGGGSADAAACLRLLCRLWGVDGAIAERIAPALGADVPACLASSTSRGEGAGDRIEPVAIAGLSGTPALLVNPRVALSTREVFARWSGTDRGPVGDWRDGRNDLESAALSVVPQIGQILEWLRGRRHANFVRMSGSGATCFALFESEEACAAAASEVPVEWWHLVTKLR